MRLLISKKLIKNYTTIFSHIRSSFNATRFNMLSQKIRAKMNDYVRLTSRHISWKECKIYVLLMPFSRPKFQYIAKGYAKVTTKKYLRSGK